MKNFWLCALALITFSHAFAQSLSWDRLSQKSLWQVSVGTGAVWAPKYLGSDKHQWKALPWVDARFDGGAFYFRGTQLGGRILHRGPYRLSAGLDYDFGRKETHDPANLPGTGRIEDSLLGTFRAEYVRDIWTSGALLKTAITGDYGTTVELYTGLARPVGQRWILGSQLSATWADDEHMKNFFGIDATQSANSGKALYSAGAGLRSYGIHFSAIYRVSSRWSLTGILRAERLVGDAADSPLSVRDLQTSVLVAAAYSF